MRLRLLVWSALLSFFAGASALPPVAEGADVPSLPLPSQLAAAGSQVAQPGAGQQKNQPASFRWEDSLLAASGNWELGKGRYSSDGLWLEQPEARKHASTLLLLKQPLTMASQGGITLALTIGAIQDADGGDDLEAAARLFLAPSPLPAWPEAYSLSDALTIWVMRHGARNDVVVALYRKVGQSGMGTLLYEGAFPATGFPLRFELTLTPDTYRLRFAQAVDSSSGSRSGYHGLPASLWGGDLRFGLRLVSHENKACRMLLRDVLLTTPASVPPR